MIKLSSSPSFTTLTAPAAGDASVEALDQYQQPVQMNSAMRFAIYASVDACVLNNLHINTFSK